MNLIDALLGEHGLFYSLFEELEAALEAEEPKGLEGSVALRGLARTLCTHAELEDELLFPALEGQIGPEGPLACMRSEHEAIHGGIVAAVSARSEHEVKRTLPKVLALAREHFSKEEQVLFPLARRVLTADQLQELGARWAQQRSVRVEQGGRDAA